MAAAPPRPARELVRAALLSRHSGALASNGANREAGRGPERLPFSLPAEVAEGDLRFVRGGAAARERAGRARLLLHLLLQRLARQPQPVYWAEEGGDGVHAAAGDGAG